MTAEAVVDERRQRIRARNRALAAVLFALAALFYAIAFVRMAGGS